MNVLVAMPVTHRAFEQLDDVIAGRVPCSGTDGAILRLAAMLRDAGISVCLSAASPIGGSIPCLRHDQVRAADFDHLIVHQSHWNGQTLTFDQALPKTILWAHVTDPVAFLYTFLDAGGRQVVFPSVYHANLYREIPQWRRQFAVIPNSYSAAFQPDDHIVPSKRLIFVGAISPHKGFAQLTRVWSYLAARQVDLQLVIAGSRSLHYLESDQALGSLGIADRHLETTCIQPWLESLPASHQPVFLGGLSPLQLRQEILRSWAAIVNPDWNAPETFCIAAVDAQACGRTVFSVAQGGLRETVYRGALNSLVADSDAAALGDRILAALSQRQAVLANGRMAAAFVRQQFAPDRITQTWIDRLAGKPLPALPSQWHSLRDLTHDLMRWSGTGMLIKQRWGGNQPVNRRVLETYYAQKQKS
jgi:glycosyltransferase involved in cell wall biosynthesis